METQAAATPSIPTPEAGTPPPAPTPAPSPAPAPMTAASEPSSSSSSIKELVAGLDWTEVLLGVLGTAALYYSIYYFRFQVKNVKAMNNEIHNKLDDLSIKVLDLQSAEKRNEQSANAGFDGVFF